jgi:hypothetical protein
VPVALEQVVPRLIRLAEVGPDLAAQQQDRSQTALLAVVPLGGAHALRLRSAEHLLDLVDEPVGVSERLLEVPLALPLAEERDERRERLDVALVGRDHLCAVTDGAVAVARLVAEAVNLALDLGPPLALREALEVVLEIDDHLLRISPRALDGAPQLGLGVGRGRRRLGRVGLVLRHDREAEGESQSD